MTTERFRTTFNRERQTERIEHLPSGFQPFVQNVKIFAPVENKRYVSIFLLDLFKD